MNNNVELKRKNENIFFKHSYFKVSSPNDKPKWNEGLLKNNLELSEDSLF